jgi:ligand-binding SRPBCC domain-containing protein
MMKAHFRAGVTTLVFLAGIGIAVAQTTVTTRETVQLSPTQRTTIYQTITKERRTVVQPAGVEVTVGTRLPQTVEVYDIPDTIVTEVPVMKRYRYMVVNNQVVLVDRDTSEVVEIIRP